MRKIYFSFLIAFCAIFSLANSVANAQSPNPVVWKTAYSKFSSSDFYIRINDTYFYGVEPVVLNSVAGTERSTLELRWKENGIEMRMNMYFRTIDNGMWEMYDLRAYNITGSNWIYFSPKDDLGNKISSLVGHRDYSYTRVFKPVDENINAEIFCKDCDITAFIPQQIPLSTLGYGIDFQIGLAANETITITTNPQTGYGVNARLVDSKYQVVLDQKNLEYRWLAANEAILGINSMSVPYPDGKCAYNIQPPCPELNVQISGKRPGVSQVKLEIINKDDGKAIATGSFDVKVVDKIIRSAAPTPTQAPVVNENKNDAIKEQQEIKNELSKLRGEVGEISMQVQEQKEEIGFLRSILLNIQSILRRFFRI